MTRRIGSVSTLFLTALCILLSGLMPSACRSTSISDQDDQSLKVLGGSPTNDFPSVGLMRRQGEAFCTGTVIGPRTILSAAHCVVGESFPPYSILQGLSFSLGQETIAVQRTIFHPRYAYALNDCVNLASPAGQRAFKTLYACEGGELNGSCFTACNACFRSASCQTCLRRSCLNERRACETESSCLEVSACESARTVDQVPFDIALLILARPLKLNTQTRFGRNPLPGETIEIVGYGPRQANRPNDVGIKNYGRNLIAEVFDTTYNFVSGRGRANLLGGDSGGPSFVRRGGVLLQVGLHSHISNNCAPAGQPVGVDQRIDALEDWIRQNSLDPVIFN